MKKFSLLAVFLCYFVVFHATAATYHWNGTDSDWNTLTNWKVGTATSNATMLALPDATALPGAGDIIVINYTSSSQIPKLPSSKTIASITIANGKSLDMNGYSLTVVGLADIDMSLANLSNGSIISTGLQVAELIFNPLLCNPVNTRITTLSVSSSFVFGATVADLISITMLTNNSASSVSIANSTFNVPYTIETNGQVTITNSIFNSELDLFAKGAAGITVNTITTHKKFTLTNNGTGVVTVQNNTVCTDDVQIISNSSGNILFKGATCSKDIELTKSVVSGTIDIGSIYWTDAVKILAGGGRIFTTPNAFVGGRVTMYNFLELGNDNVGSTLGTVGVNCNFIMGNVSFADMLTASGAIIVHGGGTFYNDVVINFFYDVLPTPNWWENKYAATTFKGHTTINITKGILIGRSYGNVNYIFEKNTVVNVTTGADFLIDRGDLLLYEDFVINYGSNWVPVQGHNFAYQVGFSNYGTLRFLGTGDQLFKSNKNWKIKDLQVNKASGVVTIDCPSMLLMRPSGGPGAEPIGNLHLTNGVLKILPTTTFGFWGNSGSSKLIGGGAHSYVDGKLMWNGFPGEHITSAVTLPIGKNGIYAPITIDFDCKTTTCRRYLYFEYFPSPSSISALNTAKEISNCEFWNVGNMTTTANASFKIQLPWSPNNCTNISLGNRTLAAKYFQNSAWNAIDSYIEPGSDINTGVVSSTNSVVINSGISSSNFFTYGYKSVIRLDTKNNSENQASIMHGDVVIDFTSGLNGTGQGIIRALPDPNEVVTLTIQGDADSEPLGLKIPMSAEGNPVVVNMLDNSPLNPALYKIIGNTVKFFNEPTDETVYEDYVINNGNGLPYTNATNIDITVAAGMTPLSLKVYRPNGTLFSENATISGQRIYSPTFNIGQIPNGSGTFTLKVRNIYNEEIDIQGHYILNR